MALDGPDGDRTSDERSERIVRHSESGDDSAAASKPLAEPRTREEYYEARAAAAAGPHRADATGGAGDRRADRFAWDATDVKTRPSLDSIRVTPERITHILDG